MAKWTIDKPAILGDWLWHVFVGLAALLNRLTLQQLIAFIPAVILFLAYYHSVPISPALMLVGDLLAYIDVFAMLFLLGLLSRATTVLFIIKQVAVRARGFVTEKHDGWVSGTGASTALKVRSGCAGRGMMTTSQSSRSVSHGLGRRPAEALLRAQGLFGGRRSGTLWRGSRA